LRKNEWYNKRDDRTKRVPGAHGFEDFSVGVVVDEKTASIPAVQIMLLVSLNILARWCRTIRVQVAPDAHLCLPNCSDAPLAKALTEMMAGADPHGDFTFGEVKEGDADQILTIGPSRKAFTRPHVGIDASGWLSGVSYGADLGALHPAQDDNPLGPAFAACLGTAEIFRQAADVIPHDAYADWYSLFDFQKTGRPELSINPEYLPDFDFGRIYQIGCGAVGSSLDFLLTLTRWKGEIYLIDHDDVDITNCNRSLAFSAFDAVEEGKKAKVCAAILRNSKMNPVPFVGTHNQFVARGLFLDFPPDIVLCLANEDNVWATIQNNYPPVVFHATTTINWGLNFGRHIPLREWCIMCRFSGQVKSMFVPPCSEGTIGVDEQGGPVHGALPFLSPAAAVLILAEMAKMNVPSYPVNKSFVEFSMKSHDGIFIETQGNRRARCLCKDNTVDLYPDEIKRTRFWNLSRDRPVRVRNLQWIRVQEEMGVSY